MKVCFSKKNLWFPKKICRSFTKRFISGCWLWWVKDASDLALWKGHRCFKAFSLAHAPRYTRSMRRARRLQSLIWSTMRRTEVKNDTRPGKMVVGRLLSYWKWNFAKSYVKLHGGNQKVSESHVFFGKSPGTHAPVLDTSCIITPPPPIMVPLQCPGDLIFHFHDPWREGHFRVVWLSRLGIYFMLFPSQAPYHPNLPGIPWNNLQTSSPKWSQNGHQTKKNSRKSSTKILEGSWKNSRNDEVE